MLWLRTAKVEQLFQCKTSETEKALGKREKGWPKAKTVASASVVFLIRIIIFDVFCCEISPAFLYTLPIARYFE
jgi:hypothetical protein